MLRAHIQMFILALFSTCAKNYIIFNIPTQKIKSNICAEKAKIVSNMCDFRIFLTT